MECGRAIWSADSVELEVDEATLKAVAPLPLCPECGFVARPNVLMFSDMHWLENRAQAQDERMVTWLEQVLGADGRLVVIECGAGKAIPTVRIFSERIAAAADVNVVRINPREWDGSVRTVGLPFGALDGLMRLDAAIGK